MNDYSTKEDEEFFGAIGRLTISWAHIEAGIDFAVLTAYHCLGGSEIERDLPRSLERKLDFLKKAAKLIEELAPYRDRLRALRIAVKAMADDRHDVIHGFAIGDLKKAKTGAIALRFLRKSGNEWQGKLVALDTITILRLAVRANNVATQSLTLGEEILSKFWRT